jgi:hypothetical protein
MTKKPYAEITVSDLQKASSVARTTFYRSFDTISDILYWKCDTCFREALGSFNPKKHTGKYEFVRHYFRYWMTHSDILELLLRVNRHDIIYTCHLKNAEPLRERYGDVPGLSPSHGNYFVALLTGFTISILTEWLKGDKKESEDEIVEIIREQIPIIARSNLLL